MNKAYLLLLLLLLMPLANAVLDVDRVRIEVNDQSIENDAMDGDDYKIARNDKVEVTTYYINTYPYPVDVILEGEIEYIKDDGDDLEDETSWKELGASDNYRQTLDFTIPSNADYDEYDLNLRVKYRNASNDALLGQWNYTFILDVREPIVPEVPPASINDVLANMSSSCYGIAQTATACFDYISKYNTCSTDLSTVAEERGQYKQKSEDCVGTLAAAREDLSQANRDKTALDGQIKGMKSIEQCNADTEAAVESAKKDANAKNSQTIGIIAIGAAVVWWWQNNKKKKSSVDSSYQSEYYQRS
jgi:hypothetical protein